MCVTLQRSAQEVSGYNPDFWVVQALLSAVGKPAIHQAAHFPLITWYKSDLIFNANLHQTKPLCGLPTSQVSAAHGAII